MICAGLAGLEGPGQAKITYILRSDLREGYVTAAGVIAMITGPRVRGRTDQLCIFEILRCNRRGKKGTRAECDDVDKQSPER